MSMANDELSKKLKESILVADKEEPVEEYIFGADITEIKEV